MWSVFNLLVTAISCSLTSYEISFTSSDEGENWSILVIRYLTGVQDNHCIYVSFVVDLRLLTFVSEVFFIIRLIGNFHLGFYDDSGVLITDVKVISKR